MKVFFIKVLTSVDFSYIIVNCTTSAVFPRIGVKNHRKTVENLDFLRLFRRKRVCAKIDENGENG